MVSIKDLYYGVAGMVKGVCDKTYYQDRPTSVEGKVDSYLVISLPSALVNRELDPSGAYGLHTTLLLEVYTRDRVSASNPVAVNIPLMDEKVKAVLSLFPMDTKSFLAARPEVVMQTGDSTGFHMTLIRARLTTK